MFDRIRLIDLRVCSGSQGTADTAVAQVSVLAGSGCHGRVGREQLSLWEQTLSLPLERRAIHELVPAEIRHYHPDREGFQ